MKKVILLLAVIFTIGNIYGKNNERVVVAAYVSEKPNVSPDPFLVTHINYAFGKVKRKTFDGVYIHNEKRLQAIVALKEINPKLKVVLSIGGWTAGGFSEMASNETTRESFIRDCAKKCEEFNLDGIDIDWEYPGSSESGIKSSPDDADNFTLLMKGLRKALGNEKTLTFASSAYGKYVKWKDVIDYLDFVNVMVYDLGRPTKHNAALYPSDMSTFSVQQAIEAHVQMGIPKEKIVLGIPFYGHGSKKAHLPDYIGFKDLPKYEKYQHKWDSVAQVPYIVDKNGNMIITYDDEKSLKLKCEYAVKNGLLGVMYWEFAYDDEKQTITRLTYETTTKEQ